MSRQPRGIRNANPGNIRWGDPWQGLVPKSERTDKDFCQFESPVWGIRAIARTFITYQDKYGLKNIRQIVQRWAPSSENNTQAYVDAVAFRMGISAVKTIDVHQYSVMKPLVEAIIKHENGIQPYDNATINEGLRRAGVVAPVKPAKEPISIGAAVTTASGAAAALLQTTQAINKAGSIASAWREYLTTENVITGVLVAIAIAGGIYVYRRYRHERTL